MRFTMPMPCPWLVAPIPPKERKVTKFLTGNVEVRKDDRGRLHVYVDGHYVRAVQSVKIEHMHPDSCTVEIRVLGKFVKLTEDLK